MIEQLFYVSGIMFFFAMTLLVVKCCMTLRYISLLINMESLTLPQITADDEISHDEIETYKQRLIYELVKTEDDLDGMTDKDIKKLYLKHEQKNVDTISEQLIRQFSRIYTTLIKQALPLKDDLESTLNKDSVLQLTIKKAFIPIYYKWGSLLAPLTVAANTASHIDYEQLQKNRSINAKKSEPEIHEN